MAEVAVHVLRPLAWLVLLAGVVEGLLSERTAPGVSPPGLELILGLLFVTLIGWLLAAIVAGRLRAEPGLILCVSLGLWAAGSMSLSTGGVPDLAMFPTASEALFIGCYVGLAAYVLRDTVGRVVRSVSVWLEVLVFCGGITCLAGALLLTPVVSAINDQSLPLLLALLYPMCDVALGLLVVAQLALHIRRGDWRCAPLIASFALFAYGDSHLVVSLATRTYGSSTVINACFGVGFALLVTHATQRPLAVANALPHRPGSLMVLTAGLCALTVLARPVPVSIDGALDALAVVTLCAVGGRLVLAIREAKQATEAFALTLRDELTHLPNRRAVLSLMQERLTRGEPLMFAIMDLNGFKDVNDTLGHTAGDGVLALVAHRIRESLRPEIMVARMGGDEFAVVILSDDEAAATSIARTMLQALRHPLTVDGITLVLDGAVGIAGRLATDCESPEILRRADVAMYQAKLTHSDVLHYARASDNFSREKLQLVEQLRAGIARHQLELWYQPQIDATSMSVRGLEALVRWRHPTRGIMSPDEFLPAARAAGLMPSLSEEVVRIVVEDLVRWRPRGMHVPVAVNCAPPELMSGIFLAQLYRAMDRAGLAPGSVVIELTEDSFIADPDRALAVLRDIRARGIEISIDDYGTGFSSLSYLRDLPVQELKIDRSFVLDLSDNARSRLIVASTVQMAHALGLRTVAEGVENAATAAALIALGVDVLQGYHLSRALPPNAVEAWIATWSCGVVSGQALAPARREGLVRLSQSVG